MASRRDLYQSYQFMVQRLISSVVLRETDPLQSPLRRMVGSAFGGVMIAILALAVAGVIGLINPGGNKSWKEAGGIILEKETGAQYVWLPDDAGVYHLHPVPNLGSGVLLTGSSEVTAVARSSLSAVPRGKELGIPNTVNSIPAKDDLLGRPWTLCSLPAESRSGVLVPNTALVVGREPTTGEQIQNAALLVRDIETGLLYLVWNSHTFAITDPDSALPALGLADATQIQVGTAWLTGLPAGKNLSAPEPPGTGGPSTAVAGNTVGTVVESDTATGKSYYIVQNDGLMPVSDLEAALAVAERGPATQVSSQQLGTMTVLTPAEPDPAELPTQMPEVIAPRSADSTVCATFGDNPATPAIYVEARVEGAQDYPASDRREQNGAVLADRVVVPPGQGALVRAAASPTDQSGPLFLVTDDGKRYALPDPSVAQQLGFAGATPVVMPAALVARIEEGAAMDPELAKHQL